MNKGSIQNIAGIPADIKAIYKTVKDISNETIVTHHRYLSPFVTGSHFMNLYQNGEDDSATVSVTLILSFSPLTTTPEAGSHLCLERWTPGRPFRIANGSHCIFAIPNSWRAKTAASARPSVQVKGGSFLHAKRLLNIKSRGCVFHLNFPSFLTCRQ